MSGSSSMYSEAVERILKERAETLARPPAELEDESQMIDLLVVRAGDEHYALALDQVLEVRPWGPLTFVPGLPGYWAGLMNLRGSLFPVLDVGRYLGLGAGVEGDQGEIVIISNPVLGVALLVEEVSGVRRVSASDVGPPLGGASSVVRGVTTDSISVLDLDKVLADGSLVVHDEAG